jgi:hypothetical protein
MWPITDGTISHKRAIDPNKCVQHPTSAAGPTACRSNHAGMVLQAQNGTLVTKGAAADQPRASFLPHHLWSKLLIAYKVTVVSPYPLIQYPLFQVIRGSPWPAKK